MTRGSRCDPDDDGNGGQAKLARKPAIAVEPIDLTGDGDGSLLDTTMALVGIGGAVEAGGIGVGEEGLDLGAQGWLVGLENRR